MSHLANKPSRKGPGFFALATEFTVKAGGSVRADDLTCLSSDAVNMDYKEDITMREELARVIDRYTDRNAIEEDLDSVITFAKNYSGYMHRNILQQDAIAVDIRFMFVRKELLEALSKIAEKTEYREIFTRDLTNSDSTYIDMRDFIYTKGTDDLILQNLSYELCKQCEMEGYRVFYEPSLEELS